MKDYEVWPGKYIVGDVNEVFFDRLEYVNSLSINPNNPAGYNEGLFAFDDGERYLILNTINDTLSDNLGNSFLCPSKRLGIRLSSSENYTFELLDTEYGGVEDNQFQLESYTINL
jgi:hypothetical protein